MSDVILYFGQFYLTWTSLNKSSPRRCLIGGHCVNNVWSGPVKSEAGAPTVEFCGWTFTGSKGVSGRDWTLSGSWGVLGTEWSLSGSTGSFGRHWGFGRSTRWLGRDWGLGEATGGLGRDWRLGGPTRWLVSGLWVETESSASEENPGISCGSGVRWASLFSDRLILWKQTTV